MTVNNGRKIALATLPLIALAVLAGQLIFFPRTEIRAARQAVLRQDLFVLRAELNQYTIDLHRKPQSLNDLVEAGYLKEIPVDPMTGRTDTWVIERSHQPKMPGIISIHSGSRAISIDGTSYGDW